MGPVRIAANVVTLNEATRIEACLRSLRWVDELIVVDGGSDDGTVELARRIADRVEIRPFDNFAAQRNYALNLTRADWVISLDADERVSGELRHEAIEAASWAGDKVWGFWVPVRTCMFGRWLRHGIVAGERKLRLFRRRGTRWVGVVHERPLVRGPLGALRNPILHESTRDLREFRRKLAVYTGLALSSREGDGAWHRLPLGPELAAAWTFAKQAGSRLGILDGPVGLLTCALAAYTTWYTYSQARARAA